MTVTTATVFALLGLGMIVLGLRGRKVDTHPICRACGFDLFNLKPNASTCPECGSDITIPRATRCGNRRRNTRAVQLGGLLVLFSSGVISIALWARSAQFDWNTVKPAWMLLRDTRSNDAKRSDAALGELTARFQNDALSLAMLNTLAERTLSVHGDDEARWSDGWELLLRRLLMRGALNDEQVVRYARQTLLTSLVMRPRVRQGHTALVVIDVDRRRHARECPLHLEVYGKTFTVGGEETLRGRGGGSTSLCALHGSFGTHVHIDLERGSYPVVAAWDVSLINAETGHQYAQWVERFESKLLVVGPDEDDIRHVSTPKLDEQMERRIRSRDVAIAMQDGRFSTGVVDFRPLPIDVAFDVYWRIGEAEHRVAEVAQAAKPSNEGRGYSVDPSLDFGIPPEEIETITVILRASSDVARGTAGTTSIWGGTLVFNDVPVREVGQPHSTDLEEALWWQADLD